MMRTFTIIATALATTGLLASCGASSSDYRAPATFVASNASVANVTTQAVNGNSSSPGLSGSPRVRCITESAPQSMSGSAGINCFIDYKVKTPAGLDSDLELIQPTSQIFKALFEDQGVQAAYIEVSGPLTSVGGQSSIGPMFSLACDRTAAAQINWDNVNGKGLRTLCTYVAIVKGLPGASS